MNRLNLTNQQVEDAGILQLCNDRKYSMYWIDCKFWGNRTWHVRFLCVLNRVLDLKQSYLTHGFSERAE